MDCSAQITPNYSAHAAVDQHSMHTHTCGELRAEHIGQTVTLTGWVWRRRDFGGLIFVDLRDREGLTQVLFDPDVNADVFATAETIRPEWPVLITGTVQHRSEGQTNEALATGEVEVLASKIDVLNTSAVPPFQIENHIDVNEDLRLKYRYVDLRRPQMAQNLRLRSNFAFALREAFHKRDFTEVETPALFKSTPEGARDFLVPSRMQGGNFYALPQSPQLLKQLLMIGGIERYYQITKCFRDEDLRADRQPEFTQIDCEMSFVDQDDVINLFEEMARHLFREIRGVELPKLEQMKWYDAMKRYGSDKPDLRFGMEFVELMDDLKGTGSFSVFDEAAYIGGIVVPGCADYSRKQLNELTDFVKRPQVGAQGLVFIKYNADGTIKSSIDKFYTEEQLLKVKETTGAKDGDLVLILSGNNVRTTQVRKFRY